MYKKFQKDGERSIDSLFIQKHF